MIFILIFNKNKAETKNRTDRLPLDYMTIKGNRTDRIPFDYKLMEELSEREINKDALFRKPKYFTVTKNYKK